MNKRIWNLLQLVVVYTNGKNGVNKRGKTASLKASFYTMLASYSMVIILTVFLTLVSLATWKVLPEYYFLQIATMLIMSVGLTLFYSFSTFFKSRDFEQYLYYPYTKTEVFYGKLFAIFIMFSPAIFFMVAFGLGFGLVVGSVAGAIFQVILNVMLSILVFLITAGIVFYIGTHPVLKKISTFLLTFGLILFIASIVFLSIANRFLISVNEQGEITANSQIEGMPVIRDYYQILQAQPWMLIIFSLVVVSLCYGVFLLLKRRAMSSYLKNILSDAVKTNSKIDYKVKKLNKTLFHHNKTLILANKQYVILLIMTMLLPLFILVAPVLGFAGQEITLLTSVESLALFSVLGMFFVAATYLYPVSESLYSLERENMDYMLALPLTRKRIYRAKKSFALILTTPMLLVLIGFMVIFLRINLINVLVLFISTMICNYIYQTYYLLHDEKSPNIHWASEMDLLQGGIQTFVRLIRYYGTYLLGALVLVLFFFTTQFWLVETLLVFAMYGALIWRIKTVEKTRHL